MTEKQGYRDEGETREAREGKQGKTRRRVSVRSRGDPGEIHRSKGFGVQGCRRKYGKGNEGRCGCREHGVGIRARRRTGKERGEDGTRTIEYGGVLGSLMRSDEGRSEEQGKRKRNSTRGIPPICVLVPCREYKAAECP